MAANDFTGRRYKAGGHWSENGSRTIRFADKPEGGVATTTYSYNLTEDERAMMARRIRAALSWTTNLTVEQLEELAKTPIDGKGLK
jgi:hypothetical protein